LKLSIYEKGETVIFEIEGRWHWTGAATELRQLQFSNTQVDGNKTHGRAFAINKSETQCGV
jgi:hypothetical protein